MKNQSGFTVIEILIVIVLVTICGIVVVNLFIGQNRIYKVQTSELIVTADARRSIDDIDNYVRQATRVMENYTTYTTGNNVLVLELRSVSASDLILPGFYDVVVYYLNGNKLYRQVFPDANSFRNAETIELSSNVNSLNFTYNDADFAAVTTVDIDLTTQQNAGVQTRDITITSKATLRNY